MRVRITIAACLFWVWVGQMMGAQAGPFTGRALLISDIHLDPLADPAIVQRLIASPAARWNKIFQSSLKKSFSAYGADANYPLFASTLAAAAAQAPFDYVVFTGDALRHDFPEEFIKAGGTSDQFPSFAAKTEEFVVLELQKTLKVPVLAAIGNNDSGCGDYKIPPESPFLATLADQLNVLAKSPEAKATFRLGGFFSIPHPTVPDHDIIVLNTVFWSSSYNSCSPNSGDAGEAQMAWLSWKLSAAKLLGRGVTLVMHIPPGMNAYSSSQKQCQNPVPFWKDKYFGEFSALMSTYSDVVQLALAGHTHSDDFRVFPGATPSLPLRITPSVSPIFSNNPGISVLSYSIKTAAVSDITTFYVSLSSKRPAWSPEYQFSRAYGVSSFSADSLSTVTSAIRSGGGAQTTFERYSAVSAPSPVHSSNVLFYSCAQTLFTATEYSNCVCETSHQSP